MSKYAQFSPLNPPHCDASLINRQVISQELASELVNLRVSNIYDLSSVSPILCRRICMF